jgi:hypothetical protein
MKWPALSVGVDAERFAGFLATALTALRLHKTEPRSHKFPGCPGARPDTQDLVENFFGELVCPIVLKGAAAAVGV